MCVCWIKAVEEGRISEKHKILGGFVKASDGRHMPMWCLKEN